MDLNFVLNDSPSTSNPSLRNADTTFNIESSTYKPKPAQHAENSAVFPHHNPSPEPPLPQIIQAYNPYQHQQGHYPTISSRSSYSGPSLQSSTAGTSPLDKPMAVSNAEGMAYANMGNEGGEFPNGSSSFLGRHLPPLTGIHPHTSALSAPTEGPLSPHSASYHYHSQTGTDAGYFPTTSSQAYPYGQPQQKYQLPIYTPSQQTHSHGYDPLLNFAEVAMGTATPSGRRSLEVEAAAEALAGRRESSGSLRQGDNVSRVSKVEGDRAVSSSQMDRSSQVDKLSGKTPSHTDIDPELRPASAGSAASTGRTIEDEASMIIIEDRLHQTHRSSGVTKLDDPAYSHDTPLFRQTPEVSTPRPEPIAISTEAGPSVSVALTVPPSPHDFLSQSPKCSYCNICTTGSPLRKVVSHIFGRNKLSTRQIPKNVWVYYCRKHYQRSRYRNPRGFARQQVLLVKRQCERLELWGGVKDWVIKVRRREELRMNREGDNGDDVDEVDDELEDNTGGEEPEPNDGGPTSGESSRRNSTVTPRRRSSTGGNNWIMRYTGMEKTITDIYRLLERIEVEVQENGGTFPDVELLPNVDLAMAISIKGLGGDGDEGGSGNPGGDENQEGADDDGVGGRKAAKKRRRSDGGSGSSGGDEGHSRGAKKAKTAAAKKGGDRKGKGKAPSHAEAIPTDKVLHQSKGAHGFQVAYQRAFSPEAPRQHEPDERIGELNVFTGAGLERQTVTPPPSTPASTGRSTPEFDLEPMQLNSSTNSFADSSHRLSPRRSARILPSTGTANQKEYACSGSLSAPKSTVDFSPAVLAAMASQSLNEFTLRRPDTPAFGGITPSEPSIFDNGHNGNESKFGKQNGPEYFRATQI